MSNSIRFKALGSLERLLRAGTGAARAVLTDWLGLESVGRAALAFALAVDGRHLDLVGGLWLQANDGDRGQICWRQVVLFDTGIQGHKNEQGMRAQYMMFVLQVQICVRCKNKYYG